MKKSTPIFKLLLLLLFIMGTTFIISAQNSFEKIDSIVANYDIPYESAAELARGLTQNLTSDEEKARVLFMWIANNVRYDCKKYHNPKNPHFQAKTKAELKNMIEEYRAKQVEKTAKYKRGICGDYSRLFKAMSDEIGLETELVTGHARDFHRPYRSALGGSHAWNAVKINEKWFLLDATWGAGYCDAGVKKFTRRVMPGFFLTPAKTFLQNHFPEDEKWQLVSNPITKQEFSEQPLINYGQKKYAIEDFAPSVSAANKNSNQTWLVFDNIPKELMVTTTSKKPIKYEIIEKEGKVFLVFSKKYKKIIIYGGKSLKRMGWLAMYET